MKKEYKDWCHEGSMPHIVLNNQSELSVEQTLEVLQNIRDDIANGAKLILDDSEEIGCKHTHASWGMCSENPKHYPDKRMYQFPAEDPPYSALRWQTGLGCPMDRERDTAAHWGCFYRCRLFRPKGRRPTQEEAIALYDAAIAELRSTFNQPQDDDPMLTRDAARHFYNASQALRQAADAMSEIHKILNDDTGGTAPAAEPEPTPVQATPIPQPEPAPAPTATPNPVPAPTYEQFHAHVGGLVAQHPALMQPSTDGQVPLTVLMHKFAPGSGKPQDIPADQYTNFVAELNQVIQTLGGAQQ